MPIALWLSPFLPLPLQDPPEPDYSAVDQEEEDESMYFTVQ